MDPWHMARILINDQTYVEIPDYPAKSTQITVPLPKATIANSASIIEASDELNCFFSSPLEKWPTKIFHEFMGYGEKILVDRLILA